MSFLALAVEEFCWNLWYHPHLRKQKIFLNDYITYFSYFQALSLCINKSVWQFPKYLYIKNHCQCCTKACQTVNIQSNCSIKYFLRGLILNDRWLLSLHRIKKVTRIAILKLLNNSSHLLKRKSQTCTSLQKGHLMLWTLEHH